MTAPRRGGGFLVTGAVLVAVLALAASPLLGAGRAQAADPAPSDPFTLQTADGVHTVKLSLSTRFRIEGWDAHAPEMDWFTAFRSRAGLQYTWKDLFTAYVEFQDARVNGISCLAGDPNDPCRHPTSGAGDLYRRNSGDSSHASSQRIRQLWLELQPVENAKLRLGRQDIKLGTEVMYPEGNWKYLKGARLAERLVGTVGWTHVERSNDGATLSYDVGEDYNIYLWGAKPTTGVFDVDGPYSTQDDILYGGASLTAKRGAWLPNTEARIFWIGYRDDRSERNGALQESHNLNIYTAGASLLGVHPMGPGNVDLMLWGAYQWGDFYDLDQFAWSALVEAGYQFTEVQMKPWVRAGINAATGDRDVDDDDNEAFFNLLPTNHKFYGFQDRFALSNLINFFLQLKLAPTAKSDLNVFLHRFQVFTGDDGRRFGTGAFNRSSFGYGVSPSGGNGSHSVGTAVDVVANYKLHPRLALQAGYTYMWGNALLNQQFSDDDVRWAYFQVTAKYP
jgi:hypothetical protein